MAKLLVFICVVAQFFCGMASVTANSRMIYAFSRDGALPGLETLAQDQPEDPHANELDLARRRAVGNRRGNVAVCAQAQAPAGTRRRSSR